MALEYKTTNAFWYQGQPPDPQPPEGEGWRMCGASSSRVTTESPEPNETEILWFWQREKAPVMPEQ
jgi:hypothetical protein